MTGNQQFRLWRAAIFLASAFAFCMIHDFLLGAILYSIPIWSEFGER